MADEDEAEKLDRELNELLQGLRVLLPGIQVLFAFLLAVPFAQGFAQVTAGQRRVFFIAFVATAVASVLLMAPSVQHRLRWRQHDKERLLRRSNRLTIAGVTVLAFAISAVVYLIADVVYDSTTATVTTAAIAMGFLVVWLIVPFVRPGREPDPERP